MGHITNATSYRLTTKVKTKTIFANPLGYRYLKYVQENFILLKFLELFFRSYSFTASEENIRKITKENVNENFQKKMNMNLYHKNNITYSHSIIARGKLLYVKTYLFDANMEKWRDRKNKLMRMRALTFFRPHRNIKRKPRFIFDLIWKSKFRRKPHRKARINKFRYSVWGRAQRWYQNWYSLLGWKTFKLGLHRLNDRKNPNPLARENRWKMVFRKTLRARIKHYQSRVKRKNWFYRNMPYKSDYRLQKEKEYWKKKKKLYNSIHSNKTHTNTISSRGKINYKKNQHTQKKHNNQENYKKNKLLPQFGSIIHNNIKPKKENFKKSKVLFQNTNKYPSSINSNRKIIPNSTANSYGNRRYYNSYNNLNSKSHYPYKSNYNNKSQNNQENPYLINNSNLTTNQENPYLRNNQENSYLRTKSHNNNTNYHNLSTNKKQYYNHKQMKYSNNITSNYNKDYNPNNRNNAYNSNNITSNYNKDYNRNIRNKDYNPNKDYNRNNINNKNNRNNAYNSNNYYKKNQSYNNNHDVKFNYNINKSNYNTTNTQINWQNFYQNKNKRYYQKKKKKTYLNKKTSGSFKFLRYFPLSLYHKHLRKIPSIKIKNRFKLLKIFLRLYNKMINSRSQFLYILLLKSLLLSVSTLKKIKPTFKLTKCITLLRLKEYTLKHVHFKFFRGIFNNRFLLYRLAYNCIKESINTFSDTTNMCISFSSLHLQHITAAHICNYISIKLGQYFRIGEIQGPILRVLRNNQIKGFRMVVCGRLTRKQRAAYFIKGKGSIPLSQKNKFIDYAADHKIMRFGLVGIKVWINDPKIRPLFYTFKFSNSFKLHLLILLILFCRINEMKNEDPELYIYDEDTECFKLRPEKEDDRKGFDFNNPHTNKRILTKLDYNFTEIEDIHYYHFLRVSEITSICAILHHYKYQSETYTLKEIIFDLKNSSFPLHQDGLPKSVFINPPKFSDIVWKNDSSRKFEVDLNKLIKFIKTLNAMGLICTLESDKYQKFTRQKIIQNIVLISNTIYSIFQRGFYFYNVPFDLSSGDSREKLRKNIYPFYIYILSSLNARLSIEPGHKKLKKRLLERFFFVLSDIKKIDPDYCAKIFFNTIKNKNFFNNFPNKRELRNYTSFVVYYCQNHDKTMGRPLHHAKKYLRKYSKLITKSSRT